MAYLMEQSSKNTDLSLNVEIEQCQTFKILHPNGQMTQFNFGDEGEHTITIKIKVLKKELK